MPMNEGNVTINGTTGAATGSGAAKEVFDALDAGQDYGDVVGPDLAAAKEQIANIARAIAKIIPHIKTNATVPSGISVSTTGTSSAQTGSTTATGTVT